MTLKRILWFNAVVFAFALLTPNATLCIPARDDWERTLLMLWYRPWEMAGYGAVLLCLLVDAVLASHWLYRRAIAGQAYKPTGAERVSQ